MFTALTLTDFKSFPQAELRFGPITTIIGANATGKSNLRDALKFLHAVGRGMTLPEIFGGKSSVGWNGIRGGAPGTVRHGTNGFSLQLTAKPELVYRIDVAIHERLAHVARESLYVNERMLFDSHPNGQTLSQEDPKSLKVLVRGGALRERETQSFGAELPVLCQIANPLARHSDVGARETIKIAAGLQRKLAMIRFLDFTPAALRQPAVPGEKTINETGDNLSSVLRYLVDDEQKESVVASWIKALTPMDVARIGFEDYPDGKILAVLKEASGRRVPLSSASDGTLRFLGILTSVLSQEPPSLLCFEEIETGLHPTRVQLVIELLQKEAASGKPQVLLTTHSPALLGGLSLEHREHAYLAYRLPETADTRLKAFREIPNLETALQRADASRLFESGWFEDAVFFAEAQPSPISFVAEDDHEQRP